ncbi:MAG: thiolase family protein [Clostridiales bacterium]|nr:thiolase family protein [Clostridiales bacterium]
MGQPVIIDGVRTPFGRRGGVHRETRPDKLLALALKGLMDRTGLASHEVEDVITGCVTQTGEQGANISRLGTLLAGFPPTVPAVSLNRMCGSSQQAIHFAAQAIAAGDMKFVVAAGVESMTRVPMFSDIAGGFETLNPELRQMYELIHQGESAERIAERWHITREEADAFSAESHRRASRAAREGKNKEIIPVEGLDPEGNQVTVTRDEGIRDRVDPEKMAQLLPAFRPPGKGLVTAGNSSQISDGASAVLVADEEAAKALGLKPQARFLARVAVGDDPTMQLTGVVPATRKALERAGLTLKDIDWVEINEAFATVVLMWAKEMGADMEKVNPWGGAIAHGHPLGATGAALMAKMLQGLKAIDGELGLQVMCIGHGMATATIIQRIA